VSRGLNVLRKFAQLDDSIRRRGEWNQNLPSGQPYREKRRVEGYMYLENLAAGRPYREKRQVEGYLYLENLPSWMTV